MSTTTTITPKPSTTVYELKDDDHLTLIGAQDTVLYKRKIFDANKNPVDVQSLLFKNKNYYDLQAYLSVGLGLETKTAKEFYEKIPRADLHDLEKLDDNIYNVSRCLATPRCHCSTDKGSKLSILSVTSSSTATTSTRMATRASFPCAKH